MFTKDTRKGRRRERVGCRRLLVSHSIAVRIQLHKGLAEEQTF